jgi:hypothetical protein
MKRSLPQQVELQSKKIKNASLFTQLKQCVVNQYVNTPMLDELPKPSADDLHSDDSCSLVWAIKHGHLEIIKYLWQPGLLTVKSLRGANKEALGTACEHGYAEVVKFMTQIGVLTAADVGMVRKAFVAACVNGHVELVKYIWQLGLLNVEDLRDKYNEVLRVACTMGHLEVVQYIWKLGLLNVEDLRRGVLSRTVGNGQIHLASRCTHCR